MHFLTRHGLLEIRAKLTRIIGHSLHGRSAERQSNVKHLDVSDGGRASTDHLRDRWQIFQKKDITTKCTFETAVRQGSEKPYVNFLQITMLQRGSGTEPPLKQFYFNLMLTHHNCSSAKARVGNFW